VESPLWEEVKDVHVPFVPEAATLGRVGATSSITSELRRAHRALAVQASHLIELIVRGATLPITRPGGLSAVVTYPKRNVFPRADTDDDAEWISRLEPFTNQVRAWQRGIASTSIWGGLARQRLLHEWLRDAPGARAADRLLRDAFLEGRGDFLSSLVFLGQSGLTSDDVSPLDDVGRAAAEIWRYVAEQDPELLAYRDRLWLDLEEYAAQSTDAARRASHGVVEVLRHVFGESGGAGHVLVHHGFHFYTPPQWALFQLLRRTPGVHQVFVVHDDGRRGVYETWRRHFGEQFDMPEIEYGAGTGHVSSPRSTALDAALSGQRVEHDGLDAQLRLVRYATETQLIRDLTDDRRRGAPSDVAPPRPEDAREPRKFAPDDADLKRSLDRYGPRNQYAVVDLTLLPIGTFLIRLHECITQRADEAPRAQLTGDALLDLVATGYVSSARDGALAAVRRALPFFQGVRDATQWRDRARALRAHVMADVGVHGPRDDSDDDVTRIERAAGNPLRLAPWLDLSDAEVAVVADVVMEVLSLVEEIAAAEVVEVDHQISWIRTALARHLQNVPVHLREELEERLSRGPGSDVKVLARDLAGAVRMLVSGESDAFPTGNRDDDHPDSSVRGIGALDTVGLSGINEDVHVAHLADHLFPRPVSTMPWPFRLEDVSARSRRGALARRLLQLRDDTAAIGDLYLLSLALAHTPPDKVVTLSWVHDGGDRLTNPALPIELLRRPDHHDRARTHIADQIGGLEVHDWRERPRSGGVGGSVPIPATAASVGDESVIRLLAPPAVASANVCARRLAIQWIVGRSAACQNAHQQQMLYGNAVGALTDTWQHMGLLRARRLAENLWRFLTPGQRESSWQHSRVGGDELKRRNKGAYWQFVFTVGLGGSKEGNKPEDRAYASARHPTPKPGDIAHVTKSYDKAVNAAATTEHGYLPAGLGPDDKDAERLCTNCPVRPICLRSADADVVKD
jgi:hypothetical protein